MQTFALSEFSAWLVSDCICTKSGTVSIELSIRMVKEISIRIETSLKSFLFAKEVGIKTTYSREIRLIICSENGATATENDAE